MKNLYFRGLTKSHLPLVGTAISTNGSVSPDAKSGICDNASNSFNNNDKSTSNTKKFQIFFGTDFSRGYGQKRFSFGKVKMETFEKQFQSGNGLNINGFCITSRLSLKLRGMTFQNSHFSQ